MATKAKAPARKAAKVASKPDKTAVSGNGGMYRESKIYKSAKTCPVEAIPPQFTRADLEFIDVDHSGASFEARVFINNPKANINTPTSEESGYAGSFHIFGHGGCFGDVGHCEINEGRDDFDPRPSHPLIPIKKVVIATEAIKLAAEQGADIKITVVPVIMSWTEKCDLDDVLKFDHINLVTYN